jgi:hypothetical protein
VQATSGRRTEGERKEVLRRGWSALLALVLVLVGAGLGTGGPRAAAVAVPSQAGPGSADGRDAAVVRAQSRLAILTHRAADPHATAAAPEPGLAASAPDGVARTGKAATGTGQRAPLWRAAAPHPYQARAPPAHA